MNAVMVLLLLKTFIQSSMVWNQAAPYHIGAVGLVLIYFSKFCF